MRTQRLALVMMLTVGWIGLVPSGMTLAQGFLPFGPRVETDPKKTYRLSDQDGPWMIMAGSFAGYEGERQAQELVLEIRRELRQPAFIYRHTIDFEEQQVGLGWQAPATFDAQGNRIGEPVRQKMRLRNLQDFDEIAVLVGNFDSYDSAKAQKILTKIKTMQPRTLMDADQRASDAFLQNRIKKHFQMQPKEELGPLRAAFICPNPMLPEEYFNPKGPDRLIYDLNKDLEFSLLRCPKPYTLRVATFRGNTSFNLEEIEEKKKEFDLKRMLGQKIESPLEEAADRVHRLTLALRERGVEAYEYHDRTSSYVCVGSFDEVLIPQADGRQLPNPRMVRLAQTFQPQSIQGSITDSQGRKMQASLKPFTLKGFEDIPFDYTPEPIEVPYYSVANDYARDPNRR